MNSNHLSIILTHRLQLILAICMALALWGCSSLDTGNDATVQNTDQTSAELENEAPLRQVTRVASSIDTTDQSIPTTTPILSLPATPIVDITPAPTEAEASINSDTQANPVVENFEMYVSYTSLEKELEDELNLIAFTLTIENKSASSIGIADGSVVFVDENYNIYPAISESTYNPYVIGSEIAAQDNIYGFVNFNLPPTIERGTLIWCLNEPYPCEFQLTDEVDELSNS